MKIIYFDTGTLQGINYIRVYGSDNSNGPFNFIEDIPYTPNKDYIEIISDYFFFKLSFIISNTESIPTTVVVSDDIGRIIDIVANDLNDTNRDDPAFSDDEYIIKIKSALKVIFGNSKGITIPEDSYDLVCKYVMRSCCSNLAYDNAKYTKITLPDGISLDKGERVLHYLDIIKILDKEIDDLMNNLGDSIQDNVLVINNTVKSYFK